MFTGLVEAVGKVLQRNQTSGGIRLAVGSSLAEELAPGESLAVNGVCLTVVGTNGGSFEADVGPETLRATTLGDLYPGTEVNLERPLRADGRVGGHFVQGHADAVGRIEEKQPEADFCWLTVSFPSDLSQYIVRKGSIAVDGISLTVAGLERDRFTAQLVPYTMAHTNLGGARVGTRVNLECDVIGKYVARARELAGPDTGLHA
jgi:riboflavin synthase